MVVGPDLPGLVCVRRVNEARGRTDFDHDEVYLALRVSDAAEVAVRVYGRPLRSERDRERFGREVDSLRSLAGEPHLVPVHSAGVTQQDRAYVVTDYCPAGSLYDHLTTVGRFTPAEVRRIGVKLAGALAGAHDRDIFHRNVKPANVLIDSSGEPALTDFGIVALATSNGDYTPPVPSTQRAYVAPEAFLPELMSAAADVYALGATLYALLAGWAPRTADPLATAVGGETLVDLPKVPWVLMSVLRRAMALDPRDRYPHVLQFGEALATAG
jgi:serine/threonine protein kinase